LNGETILSDHLEMIDQEIRETFRHRAFPAPLYNMMKYHLGWLDTDLNPTDQYRGKRFRPTLCLLTYKALSGVYEKALPAAAAIELIHNFSLIHDDIQDMDEERRHKPTVWKLWGIPQAINVGDGMHVMANLAALRMEERNVTDRKIVQILRILNETILKLCEGQYLDMSYEDRLDVTVEMYLEMISRKTSSLIEATTHVGSVLATVNPETIGLFKDFGMSIGTAFQIRDDILGIWGKEKETGKPRGSDIRNKKKTLPIIHAFQEAGEEQLRELKTVYQKERLEEKDVATVLELLEAVGSRAYAEEAARRFEERAFQDLDATGIENEVMEKLRALTTFLVRRTF
jgi:geranylgeranyl diphosphate synthase type I